MEWINTSWNFDGLEESLKRISTKKQTLDAKRPIPGYALQKIKESITLEWTYNSNSIEGNTLSLNETKLILEDGITIKGKSLREHFEAVNHQEAIELIENLAVKNTAITSKVIHEIHALILQKIEKEYAGRYRNSGVRISGANFVPPNALKVPTLMDELIEWLNDEHTAIHIAVKAALFHHRFVWVHPYFDGNGRTVRLVFNLLLMREGFPPAIILRNDRKKYYDALNKANNGDYSKIVLLVIQAIERSLDIYLSNLNNTYEEYQSIANIAEDPEIPYGQEYISLLARQGKIDAFKEGRNWLTTKEAVIAHIYNKTKK